MNRDRAARFRVVVLGLGILYAYLFPETARGLVATNKLIVISGALTCPGDSIPAVLRAFCIHPARTEVLSVLLWTCKITPVGGALDPNTEAARGSLNSAPEPFRDLRKASSSSCAYSAPSGSPVRYVKPIFTPRNANGDFAKNGARKSFIFFSWSGVTVRHDNCASSLAVRSKAAARSDSACAACSSASAAKFLAVPASIPACLAEVFAIVASTPASCADILASPAFWFADSIAVSSCVRTAASARDTSISKTPSPHTPSTTSAKPRKETALVQWAGSSSEEIPFLVLTHRNWRLAPIQSMRSTIPSGASNATPTSTATVEPTSQPNHLSDSWRSTSRAASDDARDKAVKWMFRGMYFACLIFVAEIAYLWRERGGITGTRKERKYRN